MKQWFSRGYYWRSNDSIGDCPYLTIYQEIRIEKTNFFRVEGNKVNFKKLQKALVHDWSY